MMMTALGLAKNTIAAPAPVSSARSGLPFVPNARAAGPRAGVVNVAAVPNGTLATGKKFCEMKRVHICKGRSLAHWWFTGPLAHWLTG